MKVGKQLPDTMTSPGAGEGLTRGVRPFTVRYKGLSKTVDLPGYYPAGEGEGVHVGEDMAVVDEALAELKAKAGVPSAEQIRAFREKLHLSQRNAGALLRVGENAFDKYERGLVEPSGPTVVLMALLDQHPELLPELRAVQKRFGVMDLS
jgi:HTH-type transcriptional regulator/antitoxin MqsA